MSITIENIRDFIADMAPPHLAAPWDNSGFLCGDLKQEVQRILVTLDINQAVIDEAKVGKYQLIVAHHPLFLQPLHRVVAQEYPGNWLLQLTEARIAVLAAHTNLDDAPGGVNDTLAQILGLQHVQPLDETDADDPSRIGQLPRDYDWLELVAFVKERLALSHVMAVPQEGPFRRLALCGGGGMDLWEKAQRAGAQCLLSADGKHHQGLTAKDAGMALIDGSHYGTEHIIVPVLAERLRQHFGAAVKIGESTINTCAWQLF